MSKDPFKTRLEIAKSKISKKSLYNKKDNPSALGAAFKLSTELVSAVAVGTIIGFIFDKTFGTKPWFILIFLNGLVFIRQFHLRPHPPKRWETREQG